MAEEQAQVIINLQQQVGALNNQIVALQQQLQQAPPQQARPAGQKIKMFTNEEGKDDWLSFKRHFITISNLCGYNDCSILYICTRYILVSPNVRLVQEREIYWPVSWRKETEHGARLTEFLLKREQRDCAPNVGKKFANPKVHSDDP